MQDRPERNDDGGRVGIELGKLVRGGVAPMVTFLTNPVGTHARIETQQETATREASLQRSPA